MRRSVYFYIVAFLILSVIEAKGQLSPGDLTQSHADLEGISNCTQCHELGKQVSSAKCLECHEDIKELITADRGLHAHPDTRSKDCFSCHSEHHGRKFDMVRFNQDNFDHSLTGYDLEGQHDAIECRDCHKKEFIEEQEISSRDGTFLGLSTDCVACHDDFHQGTLGEDCASCHNLEAFRPAPGFDHQVTAFPLVGGHVDVDCAACHPMTSLNGADFQTFKDIAFDDCAACHEDPHNDQLMGDCAQCHVEKSFALFTGQTGFDHSQTPFELKGSHQSTSCFACHTNTHEANTVFQDHLGIEETNCASCHEDAHEGKFGQDCAQCHIEESFVLLKNMDQFDHDLTDYPLEGRHKSVDCKACHEESYTNVIDFSTCTTCHEDYHKGEFIEKGVVQDCAGCHTVTAGFEETSYTIAQHQASPFPLKGAHMATPCFACHMSEDEWHFRDIGSDCAHCHEDVHNGSFEANGATDCTRCHDSNNWFPSLFDHDNTAFALEGKHAEAECAACHKPYEDNGEIFVQYKIEKFECIDCHQ